MLFSLEWLRQYVPVEEDAQALAHRLTMAGLTVEGVQEAGPLPGGRQQ